MNRDLLVALRHTLENAPPTAEAHLRLGTALLEEGSAREAERELRAALELDPRCAGAWVNLGGILFSRWDFAGALDANRKAADADPTLALAWVNQGLARLQLGEPDAALDALHRAIALDARNGAAYAHLAIALRTLGRDLEAEVCAAYAAELGHRPVRTSPEASARAAAGARAPGRPVSQAAPTPEGECHGSAQGR
jgi:tetratricopeptide (TPR) repeat protein